LIQILTTPKNALIKQYQKLLAMDGVTLKFAEGTFQVIAKHALKQRGGARGLRTILENAMLDTMYEIPGDESVREIIITPEVIADHASPIVICDEVGKT